MIVLINTPLKLNEYHFTSTQYPINLGYLASFLLKNNFSVKIIDYAAEKFKEDEFIKRLKIISPKIVGFSCITPNIKNGANLALLVKKNFQEILTIVGGPHSTVLPDRTLKEFSSFDVVVIGEGEQTLLDICKREMVLDGIPGIAFRKNKEIKIECIRPLIENLDTIPFPNRELVPSSIYENTHPTKVITRKSKKIMEIITSRGCPYNCAFCAGHEVFQNTVRLRSVENIIAEVEEWRKKTNVAHLTILDNTFTLNKERLLNLCKFFKKENLTFDCNSRVDTVDEEILQKMAEGGCFKISFGIESGSERILKLIDKRTNLKQIKETIKTARKVGIPVLEGTAIVGSHPSETLKELNGTISLLHNLDLDYIVMDVIVPYPGSPISKYMKEKGLILGEDWNKYVPYGEIPDWRTENFSPEQLVKLQRKIMFGFYFRPKYILKRLRAIKSFYEFLYWFKILIDFIFKFKKKILN